MAGLVVAIPSPRGGEVNREQADVQEEEDRVQQEANSGDAKKMPVPVQPACERRALALARAHSHRAEARVAVWSGVGPVLQVV